MDGDKIKGMGSLLLQKNGQDDNGIWPSRIQTVQPGLRHNKIHWPVIVNVQFAFRHPDLPSLLVILQAKKSWLLLSYILTSFLGPTKVHLYHDVVNVFQSFFVWPEFFLYIFLLEVLRSCYVSLKCFEVIIPYLFRALESFILAPPKALTPPLIIK